MSDDIEAGARALLDSLKIDYEQGDLDVVVAWGRKLVAGERALADEKSKWFLERAKKAEALAVEKDARIAELRSQLAEARGERNKHMYCVNCSHPKGSHTATYCVGEIDPCCCDAYAPPVQIWQAESERKG